MSYFYDLFCYCKRRYKYYSQNKISYNYIALARGKQIILSCIIFRLDYSKCLNDLEQSGTIAN